MYFTIFGGSLGVDERERRGVLIERMEEWWWVLITQVICSLLANNPIHTMIF